MVGVEFGEAVPGSSTRTAYFGTRISASEINDYLTSVDSLAVPGSPESSLSTIALPVYRPNQDGGLEASLGMCGPDNIVRLSLPSSVPRGVNANKYMRESYLIFILEEYQRHIFRKFFRPLNNSQQGSLLAHLKRPRITRFMYLGAKIFEIFVKKPEEMAIQSCSEWVTWYTNHVTNPEEPPNPFPSTQEVEDKLNGLLHLIIIQLMVFGTPAGYTTLSRLALPSVLRLLSEIPGLWTEQEPNGLVSISLPAILTHGHNGIHRFIVQDIIYSLILGLPTLAEYDSTGLPVVPGITIPADRFHDVQGVPAEMVIIIAEVHSWRARKKKVDWRALEMKAWAWNPRDTEFEQSDQMIYRNAVQEAWRHTALIYIYMGMCGASSHDPRVQHSVKQIVKLMEVVGDTDLDVHFSAPSIVAGIAARYERQRTLIFQKLNSFVGVRLWILRGRDFAQVLVDLWHGRAIGGAAIMWDDYVQATCRCPRSQKSTLLVGAFRINARMEREKKALFLVRKKCDRNRPICGLSTESLPVPIKTTEHSYTTDTGPRGTLNSAWSGQSQSGSVPSSRVIRSDISTKSVETIFPEDVDTRLELLDGSENSVLSAGVLELMAKSRSKPQDLSKLAQELEAFDGTWPQEHSQSLVRARTFDPGIGPAPPTAARVRISPSVKANARMRESYFTFLLSEYEIHRLRKFFRPPPVPQSRGLTHRMKRSNTMLGFMYLGAKVFEVLMNRPKDAVSDCCKKWIANFDRQIMGRPPSNPSTGESEDRLTGLLELVYLTFLVVDTVAGYALLKRALPLFLQLVSNDAELCTERRGQLVISLPRVLSTPRYEIRRPLAEYDPGEPPVVTYPPLPMELFHGIPVEWILIIGHVHTRASDWGDVWGGFA
ncbi:unnamed protein product [Rhizoctonia solani]|uniref:Uncharacterized protein n=1 Tax=Rhizoctonia solani TaxID=456999 RepID=A0A8H2XY69_9AGAM|nr:unnamed protein product [Rhizoctonia solani]